MTETDFATLVYDMAFAISEAPVRKRPRMRSFVLDAMRLSINAYTHPDDKLRDPTPTETALREERVRLQAENGGLRHDLDVRLDAAEKAISELTYISGELAARIGVVKATQPSTWGVGSRVAFKDGAKSYGGYQFAEAATNEWDVLHIREVPSTHGYDLMVRHRDSTNTGHFHARAEDIAEVLS